MQIDGLEESDNVEDQRGRGPAVGATVGGGGLIILVLALIFGVNPQQLAGLVGQKGGGGGGGGQQREVVETEQSSKAKKLVSVVLRDTEKVWDEQFAKQGLRSYPKPKLTIFSGSIKSACGNADAAMGPFYCPGDKHVYIDLDFFNEMEKQLRIPGEFPRAYVIAHEVGHHVQNLTGYSQKADAARGTSKENEMSVRLELQADYLAGVWAFNAKDRFKIDPNDVEQAINAAKQIGDDTLQRNATGRVRPEKFTHGTSAQRMRWFKRGFETGDFSKAALDKLFTTPYTDL
ncbi:neutral zinc metallopeptidase [Telmatocola sphagniphila]|uniref:Neutral zinc metallopeptidase n=1 Tax=Telmatocola sphagniphila TaxID=1123043 RepID=A0A8E6BC30_9BACT|nr:neutral zinc metallopeptidase [Telmatocola sphagniphila]QVL34428.1 neutral zinc metallopeptidase [Telmatocola sphagniphila]